MTPQGQCHSSCHSGVEHMSTDSTRPWLGAGEAMSQLTCRGHQLRLQWRGGRQLLGTEHPSIPFQTNTCSVSSEITPSECTILQGKTKSLWGSQNGRVQPDKMSSRHQILSEDCMELHSHGPQGSHPVPLCSFNQQSQRQSSDAYPVRHCELFRYAGSSCISPRGAHRCGARSPSKGKMGVRTCE